MVQLPFFLSLVVGISVVIWGGADWWKFAFLGATVVAVIWLISSYSKIKSIYKNASWTNYLWGFGVSFVLNSIVIFVVAGIALFVKKLL